MRVTVVLGVVLVLAAACTDQPEQQPGAAAPVGDPAAASAPATPPPAASEPSPVVASSAPPARPSAATTRSRPAGGGRVPEIRRTDWANVTIHGLAFCLESDSAVRFRDGSNGLDIPCLLLPRGAKPVYAEFLTESPANAPITEDALVLVELGRTGGARQQALVPVQIGYDGRTRNARPVIKGDEPGASIDEVMTFTSYRVDDARNHVITTVKTRNGRTETRRYRQMNHNGDWERF